MTPEELQVLMAGFPRPWWLVEGHAIEAFTGVRRAHDMSIFVELVPDFRRQLEDRYHLWSNYGGTFRFFEDRNPANPWPLLSEDKKQWAVRKYDPDHAWNARLAGA